MQFRRGSHPFVAAIGLALGLSLPCAAVLGQSCPQPPIPLGPDSIHTLTILEQTAGDPIVEPRKWVQPPDTTNRFFWIEQTGTVRVLENGAPLPTPVLTIGAWLYYGQQRGLLGFAFHKDFADPNRPGHRRMYTWHNEPRDAAPPDYRVNGIRPQQVVLTEWQMSAQNPNVADPASRREMLRCDQGSPVHAGGCMEFGPDGYLYISFGTPANDPEKSQDNTHPDGTIMRIDPLHPSLTPTSTDPVSTNGKYRVPADNPLVGQPGMAPEIFAWGLRHPWQFSIDPVSGLLLCGDVGQATAEEVNVVVRGGNYGWPYREGLCAGILPAPNPPPVMIDPLITYDREEGRSNVGAHVYRGDDIPALYGKLLTADLTNQNGFFNQPGRLFYATVFDSNGALLPANQITLEELRINPGNPGLIQSPVAFGIDRRRELYLMGVVAPFVGAIIEKIVPPSGPCYADCDQSTGVGVLDIFDFLCFQNAYDAQQPYACDCDVSTGPGVCDIFDFLCFQNAYDAGCP